jgi:hypothetical protein
MLRDKGRKETLEEFGLVNISFGGLLPKQSRRWVREELHTSVEVSMD